MADPASLKAGVRSAFRDFQVDGVPASGVQEPDKAEIRPALVAIVDYAEEVAQSAVSGVKGYATASALPDLASGDAGTLAKVEDVGLVYRWTGTDWEEFADPTVTAAEEASASADRAEAAAVAGTEAQTFVGSSPDAFEAITYGSTVPDTSDASTATAYGPSAALPFAAAITAFSIRANGVGTGQIVALVPQSGSTYIVERIWPVSIVAGVNTFNVSDYTAPSGTRFVYKWISGSHVRFISISNGSLSSVPAASIGSVGDEVTLTVATGLLVAVAVTVRQSALASRRIDQNLRRTAMIGDALNGRLASERTHGTVVPDATQASLGYVVGVRTKKAITLTSISVRVATVSTGYFLIWVPGDDGAYVVQHMFAVDLAAGVNTIAVSRLFVPKGGVISYKPLTGSRLRCETGAGEYLAFENGVSIVSVGDTSTPIVGVAQLALSYTGIEGVDVATPLRALEQADFATLPLGWTNSGGIISSGLTFSAPGWAAYAVAGRATSMSRRRLIARARAGGATDIFGICAKPANGTYSGAALVADGVAGKLRLHSWAGSGAGTMRAEVNLPALVAGRDYMLTVDLNVYTVTATFTDIQTQQQTALTADGHSVGSWYALFQGLCGVIAVGGSPRFDLFKMQGAFPSEKLRAIILGDSIVDGASTLASPDLSWAQQVAANRPQKDVLVSGRAGDTSTEGLLRAQHDFYNRTADFAILALGTNDGSQSAWRINMGLWIDHARSVGSEPILCTQVPRASSQALRTAMNDDIRSGYFGRVRFIDFAKAVSQGNDGVTWNPAYDWGDAIHPNLAGHTAMYQQALIDVPELRPLF